MLKTLVMRGLAALGLVALASCAPVPEPAASAGPRPAMWRVADQDTTIYLFGTIHLLPPNSTWRTPAFDAAVQQSDVLVVETLIDAANPQQLASEMAALGFSSGLPPIAQRVPPEKLAALEAAIARTAIPRPLFDRMETWAAAFTLMGVQFQTLGLQGEQGVEAVLRQAFTAAGKPVEQLETNREQLSLFDRLPERAQRQLLEGAIEAPTTVREQFSEMLRAWLAGDVESIARTFNRDLSDSPELKAALLTRRNANWADWIHRRLAQPGTVMIAVGAGHLTGDVSVQRYLESRGIQVRRVQ
jgi:uncharacterized protein YbaP (TraB family)